MVTIINFKEYVKKRESNQQRKSKGVFCEIGRIVYFDKKEVIEQ